MGKIKGVLGMGKQSSETTKLAKLMNAVRMKQSGGSVKLANLLRLVRDRREKTAAPAIMQLLGRLFGSGIKAPWARTAYRGGLIGAGAYGANRLATGTSSEPSDYVAAHRRFLPSNVKPQTAQVAGGYDRWLTGEKPNIPAPTYGKQK